MDLKDENIERMIYLLSEKQNLLELIEKSESKDNKSVYVEFNLNTSYKQTYYMYLSKDEMQVIVSKRLRDIDEVMEHILEHGGI